MEVKKYASPEAFRQAVEQRIRSSATSGMDFARQRQLLVFDRFLARVVAVLDNAVTLKGGLVLELRITRARATNDVDLCVSGNPTELLERLSEAARFGLDDYMTFEVATDRLHPTIQNDGMLYDGMRFRAECKIAGKVYGRPFGVDVAFGDPLLGDPETVTAEDRLAFAGIAPPTLRIYPIETHIAEKLHAYTMPRVRPNTRVKDLPDIALLATAKPVASHRLRAALEQTFTHRNTHPLPTALPAPLMTWAVPFVAMAKEDALPWSTLDEVYRAASSFLDPVLAGSTCETWKPDAWHWQHTDTGS